MMLFRHVCVMAGIVCLMACGAGGARQALAGAGGADAVAINEMLERSKALRAQRKIDAALDVLFKAREKALKAGNKTLLYKIYVRIGGVDLAHGDSGEALAAFNEARKTAQALAKGAKRPAPWLHEVFGCYQRIGDIDMNLRGVEQAAAAYQAGLSVARRMVALEPDEAEWKMDLVRALGKAAAAGAGPLTYLEEALAILKDVEAKGQLIPARRFWAERIGKALEMARRKQGKGEKAGNPAK